MASRVIAGTFAPPSHSSCVADAAASREQGFDLSLDPGLSWVRRKGRPSMGYRFWFMTLGPELRSIQLGWRLECACTGFTGGRRHR